MISCSSSSSGSARTAPAQSALNTINKALARYRFRQICREISAHDGWLLCCAEGNIYESHDLGHMIHSPGTLDRLRKLLEQFGASTATANTHAKVFVLALLLSGLSRAETSLALRPHPEDESAHPRANVDQATRKLAKLLGQHFALLCTNPEATYHRAKILVAYPQFCMQLKKNWSTVFREVRRELAQKRAAHNQLRKRDEYAQNIGKNQRHGDAIVLMPPSQIACNTLPPSVCSPKMLMLDRPLAVWEQTALRMIYLAAGILKGIIVWILTLLARIQ